MSRLGELMPRWHFRELHAIDIAAPPDRVYAAVRAVTAREIRFFRLLTFIRRLGRPLPPGILNPPPDDPLIDVAIRGGFRLLVDDPPREIVVALRIGSHTEAVMNFLVQPTAPAQTHLTTETRVHAATRPAQIAFAAYWLLIRPWSGLLRHTWLRAIRRRSQAG